MTQIYTEFTKLIAFLSANRLEVSINLISMNNQIYMNNLYIVKLCMNNIEIRRFMNIIEEVCFYENLSAEDVIYFFVDFRVCLFLIAF